MGPVAHGSEDLPPAPAGGSRAPQNEQAMALFENRGNRDLSRQRMQRPRRAHRREIPWPREECASHFPRDPGKRRACDGLRFPS